MFSLYIVFILSLILCFLVSGNNAAVGVGIILGSGALRRRGAKLTAALGVFLGSVLEGWRMNVTIPSLIDPGSHTLQVSAILTSSIIVFYILTFKGVPVSLSQTVIVPLAVLGILGLASVQWLFTATIMLSWVISPVIAISISMLTYIAASRLTVGWRQITVMKILVTISGFYIAYVTGANLVGFIYSNVAWGFSRGIILVFGLISALSTYIISERVAVVIGFQVVRIGLMAALLSTFSGGFTVHLFTLFSIPVSVTQCVTAGVFGVCLAAGFTGVYSVRRILYGWGLAVIASAMLSLILFKMLA